MFQNQIEKIQEQKNMIYKNRFWLKRKYVDEGLSIRAIADMCGVAHRTIHYHLKKHGIDTRRKNAVKMDRIYVYFPYYFLDSLREFSDLRDEPISLIARNALADYMLAKRYNPFNNRKFRDKNV